MAPRIKNGYDRIFEHLDACILEMVSGTSSLNMPAEKKENLTEDDIFLADCDINVSHAMEHFHAVIMSLSKLAEQCRVKGI